MIVMVALLIPMVWQVNTIVWSLAALATMNAAYTLRRTRKYRLFEADVEKPYDTPSAQRVRVQSTPMSSSPLRILTDIMSNESAESRAHPDRSRDVWELSVWDPLPMSLQMFCLFSPGHVLVYWMFLPLATLDARPSVTIFNCLVLQAILSAQLLLLQSKYTQQNKDTAIIQKEVMHEYDTKFVHPRLYPSVRDACTQISQDETGNNQEFAAIGTPTTLLRRGFKTNPNPNYTKYYDPDGTPAPTRFSAAQQPVTPGFFTPPVARHSEIFPSSIKPRAAASIRQSTPGFSSAVTHTPQRSVSTSTSMANIQPQVSLPQQSSGGYMGVFTHPSSPLKKAPSLGELQHRTPRNNSEMAQLEQYQAYRGRERSASPVKSARKSTGALPSATQQAPNPYIRNRGQAYERYPKMWH